MSHFTVLVVGTEFGAEQVDKLLWPFWELDLSREDMRKDPRAKFDVQIPSHELEDTFEAWKEETAQKKRDLLKQGKEIPDFYQKRYSNAEDWVEGWHGYYQNEHGDWGYYHNPNDKWDWYVIGGRWLGFFKPKDGSITALGEPGAFKNEAEPGFCDQIRKCDIDVEGMKKARRAEFEETWGRFQIELDGDPSREGTLRWIYGIDAKTKEEYLDSCSKRHPCATFAVLMDGQWYERGEMGWWGIVSDEKQKCDWGSEFDAIWNEIPDDAVLTLVDCHI